MPPALTKHKRNQRPMLDRRKAQLAFSHDPLRRSDRLPAGAVPAGTVVAVTLRIDAGNGEDVREAWLEVLDVAADAEAEGPAGLDASASAHDAGGLGAAGRFAWKRIPLQPVAGGLEACIDTAGEPRVLFYRFHLVTAEGDVVYGRREDGLSTAGQAVALPDDSLLPYEAHGFQLTVHDPAFAAPAWFAGHVMYQIFPDRFARGTGGVRWEGVEAHERRGWPVRIHEDWNEAPDWREPYDPVDFFGGTLQGIEEGLDYLASLGVRAVYLNPVCEARSNHRYNTGDYEAIDPLLGTWDDFRRLAAAAEERGIRLVLDAVLSHTGAASRYFNADGSYDSFGAAQGEGSPYRSWYDFTPMPTGAPYRCWWGDETLPETNERDASWQRYMLGEDGVLAGWFAAGAKGVRLDVADEVPDDVLEKVRSCVKGSDADAVIIGEVWEDPTTKESYGQRRTYALGRVLDSVMNYPLREALLRYALDVEPAAALATFLKLQKANYPGPLYASLMNLLSSHDVERVRSVLAVGSEFRDRDRSQQAALVADIDGGADWRASRLQRILATLLYTLPGVPCLYYGDERGMQGGRDPFDRATFPWSGPRADCGQDLTECYRDLGRLRNSLAALQSGSAAFYSCGTEVVAVLRVSRDAGPVPQIVLCAANRSDVPQTIAIDLVDASAGLAPEDAAAVRQTSAMPRVLFAAEPWRVNADVAPTCEDGIFTCRLDGMQACVFALGPGLAAPLERGTGVICHVTSLPNPGADGENVAFGTLGAPARRFVDALVAQGVRYWQILPLNPTDEFGSPYAGLSAFAGNTRLLAADELPDAGGPAYDGFLARNAAWLLPYATFAAIKAVVGEVPWQQWPEAYRTWRPELANDPALAAEVRRECERQFAFDWQWRALRAYANARGVRIVGDMPIYVSVDSADVWAHQEYFSLDENGCVADQGGVPPDPFAAEGQLWGNPTYRWDVLRENGYDWWLDRFGRLFDWYDYVRIDHFIGLESYYAIPAGKTAFEGSWLPGPGIDLFERAYERFGPLPVIAEDLGLVTPAVKLLLARTGMLGMGVLQFADGDPREFWKPDLGKMCYTSTHDTSTLLGWVKSRYGLAGDAGGSGDASGAGAVDSSETVSSSDSEPSEATDAAGPSASSPLDAAARALAREFMAKVVDSDADVVVFSLQDVLELDDSARMNVPGTTDENWGWQARQADLEACMGRLRRMTRKRR
ncbi:4-alpha-glucanotransferase [Eggerthellaceae bacterium zg-893]|nr:4-alpha-glucanotransferase [Eggerthellaceae bacterium zg-893]